VASGDYFHMDLLVAQSVFASGVKHHVDVGSRIDGFVAHVASFAHVEVFDIRPLSTTAANISFRQVNLFDLGDDFDGYTDSLSCLHVLEHFGLGRYGDPIDPGGHIKGWRALERMVRPGGRLYFATPIGIRQRIEFDAHRVFSIPFLLELMTPCFRIDRFSTVDDEGNLHVGQDPESPAAREGFAYRFGCGIFELTKMPF
jgi:SAM-dependent methyltransferase